MVDCFAPHNTQRDINATNNNITRVSRSFVVQYSDSGASMRNTPNAKRAIKKKERMKRIGQWNEEKRITILEIGSANF